MKKRKRIVFFGVKYFPSKGGTSRVVENLIFHLKEDYNITLYCYKDKNSKNYIKGIKIIEFPRIPFGSIGVFMYYFTCCLHILMYDHYDLIHVHKIDAAFFIPLLRLKAKVIATSHESPYTRDKWTWLAKLYFHLNEKIFIRNASLLTSISKLLSEYYNNQYKVNVRYIPNGVNIINTFNVNEANAILQKFNVKEDYVIFAARRIMSTKGCHTFLKALRKHNYTGTALIAGDTSQLPKYTEQLKELSKDLNVKFIGYVHPLVTLLALIKKSKLFIFPSEYEGMSIMLLEVVSTKTPIIASNIPENTMIFNDDEVLFFENKNSDDLAIKIEWAFTNIEKMKQNAENAFNKVKIQYSWGKIANKYSELYDNLMQGSV